MTKFNVLPTDPSFNALTVEQLDYIISSMIQDNKEMEDIQKGVKTDVIAEDDSFSWGGELVLPTAELDEQLAEFKREAINEEVSKIQEKLAMGKGISEKDQHTLEFVDEREKIMSEFDNMMEVISETGMSVEDYKLYGAPSGYIPKKDRPTTNPPQNSKSDDESVLDDIISDFNDDDDFVDLT